MITILLSFLIVLSLFGCETKNKSLQKGNAYFNSKEYKKAIEQYSKVLEKDTDNKEALFKRADSYKTINSSDKAIADYSKLINLQPDNLDYRINRALIYKNTKKFDKALSDFDYAIKKNPNIAPYYVQRGMTYIKLNKPDDATADFNKALTLDPNQIEAKKLLQTIETEHRVIAEKAIKKVAPKLTAAEAIKSAKRVLFDSEYVVFNKTVLNKGEITAYDSNDIYGHECYLLGGAGGNAVMCVVDAVTGKVYTSVEGSGSQTMQLYYKGK